MAHGTTAGMNPAELWNIAQNERTHWWYCGMRSILAALVSRHLADRNVRNALDAGCGTGYTAQWLKSVRPWNFFLTDIEDSALAFARRLGLSNLVEADLRCLPFCDARFELALSLDVLVHVPRGHETQSLAELFRVLKPGGLLIVRVAALDVLRSRHSEFIDEKQRFTRGRLRRTAVQSGFRVLRCTYSNSLLLPLAFAKFRIWEPLLRKPPASGVEPLPNWLATLLYWPLALEAKWLGAGLDLSLGQSLFLIGEKPGPAATGKNSEPPAQ